MSPLPCSVRRCASLAGLLSLAALSAAAQSVLLTPASPAATYAVGEKVSWTVSVPAGGSAWPSGYTYSLRKNNSTTLASGTFSLGAGPVTLETTLDEPAMVYLTVTPVGATKSVAGAAVAPASLQPSVARPADFDAFWRAKLDALAAIPVNAVVTPGDSGRAGIDYALVRLDNVNGAHVYGQLAKPSRDGKFPALLILQWAGVYGLQKAWVTDRAAEGWLALNVEPHDLPGDQPDSYYAALPASIKNYHTIGADDRDKSYFLRMYLGDCRALEYLATRPEWDGKVLLVTGGSMGGQQSLAVSGLRPDLVTHTIVVEPAGCDANGALHGRATGYPYWNSADPKVMAASLYFDPVNFAPRIRSTTLIAMGYVDTTAPPVGIWIAANQISSLKETIPLLTAPHNDTATYEQMKPYYDRSYAWTSALVRGAYPKINPAPATPALTWDEPVLPRAGGALSAAQLNARASVPGTFSYVPASGTILAAGAQTVTATFTPYDTVNFSTATRQFTLAVPPPAPAFTAAPTSAGAAPGASVTLTAAANPPSGGPAVAWQWQRNGAPLPGANAPTLALPALAPADAGLYAAAATSGDTATSAPAIVGLLADTKALGTGHEIAANIYVAANGNTFDQVLLEGIAVTVTADQSENQITRTSYLDLDDDIVQVEFSGPGSLTLVLADPSGPALPAKYNQGVYYMKGHAGLVITGADQRSHVAIFSVGRATAVNQTLFRDTETYDGIADVAFLAIHTTNGRFGGVRTANAHYFASRGFTGLYAPGVAFDGPVFVGDITAFDSAQPVLVTGAVSDARITGGNLAQDNRAPVLFGTLRQLKFTAGTDSHGRLFPAQTNRAVLLRNGENVTSQVVLAPAP